MCGPIDYSPTLILIKLHHPDGHADILKGLSQQLFTFYWQATLVQIATNCETQQK